MGLAIGGLLLCALAVAFFVVQYAQPRGPGLAYVAPRVEALADPTNSAAPAVQPVSNSVIITSTPPPAPPPAAAAAAPTPPAAEHVTPPRKPPAVSKPRRRD